MKNNAKLGLDTNTTSADRHELGSKEESSIPLHLCNLIPTVENFVMKLVDGTEWAHVPWPQTILKQLKEWHVIVFRDQSGETLGAAPTQLNE